MAIVARHGKRKLKLWKKCSKAAREKQTATAIKKVTAVLKKPPSKKPAVRRKLHTDRHCGYEVLPLRKAWGGEPLVAETPLLADNVQRLRLSGMQMVLGDD